jgi:hypothetical protein
MPIYLGSTYGGAAERCVSDDDVLHISRRGQLQDMSD